MAGPYGERDEDWVHFDKLAESSEGLAFFINHIDQADKISFQLGHINDWFSKYLVGNTGEL